MSDRLLTRAAITLALAGVGVAGYLTWVHYRGLEPLCLAGGGGCERVQASSYSKLAGVPVAVLGLGGYLAILACVAIRTEAGRLGACLLAITGCAFSAYLTYRELFTIDAICQWCVASALLMTALAVTTTARYVRG